MLNRFAFFRERGWIPISAAEYAALWHRYGGSVATHPEFVARLSELSGIPTRYLGWPRDGEIVAAIPVWGHHLALSKAALKALGKKRLFDLGNAEVILPVAPEASGVLAAAHEKIPLRHAGHYLAARHEADFSGLKRQRETLALLKAPDAFSAKFRYNQRREWRLLLEAGGEALPIQHFSPAQRAAMYLALFERRWGFPAPGASRMTEVFTALSDWMRGSALLLEGKPVAVQVLYRVESPRWISVEFINGGVAPETRRFSPGSVLTWLNVEAEWENAAARGKPLRYSFGRADQGYKSRWCETEPVCFS